MANVGLQNRLYTACYENYFEEVTRLISIEGADPNYTYPPGAPTVFFMNEFCSKNIIFYFISVWANSASHRGFERMDKNLHFSSHDCNQQGACWWRTNGNLSFFSLKVQNDNIEIFYKGGKTPLHLAAGQGHTHIIRILLGQGCNINKRTRVITYDCL